MDGVNPEWIGADVAQRDTGAFVFPSSAPNFVEWLDTPFLRYRVVVDESVICVLSFTPTSRRPFRTGG